MPSRTGTIVHRGVILRWGAELACPVSATIVRQSQRAHMMRVCY